MLFAISDIHGHYDEFNRLVEALCSNADFVSGKDKLILLGDYIDYGTESYQVLCLIHKLCRTYDDNVIALKGNREVDFLEWLRLYTSPCAGDPDEYGFIEYNGWLDTDSDLQTFRTLITEEQWQFFRTIAPTCSELTLNIEAARMVLSNCKELIFWLQGLPCYYETERQIFVHAGVDEDAGDWWQLGTPESTFVGKFPATTGRFHKDIIAGHVAASTVAGDPGYRGIYFDGKSHFYIDGAVYRTGRLLCLAYDEKSGRYYEVRVGEHGVELCDIVCEKMSKNTEN